MQELRDGEIETYTIAPEDFGLKRCRLEDIATGTPEENAAMIREVFSGKDRGPRHDAVALNAAGALMIGGKAGSMAEGVELARELIGSGAARRKLKELYEASHDLAGAR